MFINLKVVVHLGRDDLSPAIDGKRGGEEEWRTCSVHLRVGKPDPPPFFKKKKKKKEKGGTGLSHPHRVLGVSSRRRFMSLLLYLLLARVGDCEEKGRKEGKRGKEGGIAPRSEACFCLGSSGSVLSGRKGKKRREEGR